MIAGTEESRTLVARAFSTLQSRITPAWMFVPGRIEIFGKHTDYAGGHSLTCATERGLTVAFSPRGDGTISILDASDGRRETFPLSAEIAPTVGHWSNYPMTVGRRLARNFPGLSMGADIAFASTLPKAAGLSSSSALVTAVYFVLAEVNALAARGDFRAAVPSMEALAGYLGCIENGRAFGALAGDHGVGTAGGSQDHTAIVLSAAGHVSSYRYHPVSVVRRLPLDPHLTFVVGASGVAAVKTGGARESYNRAAALVGALVAEWRRATGRADVTLADALASGGDAPSALDAIARRGTADFDGTALSLRLQHFILEDGVLVPAAIAAFASGDLDELGRVSDESQIAAERLLGNQVPETIALARLARAHGALAASAFGAGFGGSVWALIDTSMAQQFLERWSAAYRAEHPVAADASAFFVTRPGIQAQLLPPQAGTRES